MSNSRLAEVEASFSTQKSEVRYFVHFFRVAGYNYLYHHRPIHLSDRRGTGVINNSNKDCVPESCDSEPVIHTVLVMYFKLVHINGGVYQEIKSSVGTSRQRVTG